MITAEILRFITLMFNGLIAQEPDEVICYPTYMCVCVYLFIEWLLLDGSKPVPSFLHQQHINVIFSLIASSNDQILVHLIHIQYTATALYVLHLIQH